MKKRILFTVFALSVCFAHAQSFVYHPFPTSNAIWENRIGTFVNPPYDISVNWAPPIYYCMEATDTLIGSVNYSKIDSCGGPYRGALRDDGVGKIYFIPADSINELLIYDFTIHAGDTVTVYAKIGGTSPFTKCTYVDPGPVDSILINGSYRKRIRVEAAYWIEGIGNSNGLFVESWPNVSNYTQELHCMSVNDTSIFPSFSIGACSFTDEVIEQQNEGQISIFPNPSNGKFQLVLSNLKDVNFEIKDVLGKRILVSKTENKTTEFDLSNQPKGIYFLRVYDSKGNLVTKKIVKE